MRRTYDGMIVDRRGAAFRRAVMRLDRGAGRTARRTGLGKSGRGVQIADGNSLDGDQHRRNRLQHVAEQTGADMVLDPLAEVGIGVLVPVGILRPERMVQLKRDANGRQAQETKDQRNRESRADEG